MKPEFDMKKVTTPLLLHMVGRIPDGRPACNFVWELHQRPGPAVKASHV